MIWHTQRDKDGHTLYPSEHDPGSDLQSAHPKSNQFDGTGATLGVSSRGFHFTGRSTASDQNDKAIHSDKSVLFDARDNNENFIEARNGTQANPSFKDYPVSISDGNVPSGVTFAPSQSEPADQGGAGPSWWDRIVSNFRNGTDTQSTNAATKPPEKFQIGLRSLQPTPVKDDHKGAVRLGITGVTGSNPGSTRGT